MQMSHTQGQDIKRELQLYFSMPNPYPITPNERDTENKKIYQWICELSW